MRQVPMIATRPPHDLARVDIEHMFLWGQVADRSDIQTSLGGDDPHTT